MLIDKNSLPLVAMDFMNEVHFEDIAIINELSNLIISYEEAATKEAYYQINSKYMQWCNHSVSHFKKEEEQMLQKGFPVYTIHKQEHENILKNMSDVFESWEKSKEISYLKEYIFEFIPQWLVNHINSMDRVTAIFLKTGQSPCMM